MKQAPSSTTVILPTILHFEIYPSSRWIPTVVEWNGHGFTVSDMITGEHAIPSPPEESWIRFWKALESNGVWRWRKSYLNNANSDRCQWFLELVWNGKTIKSHGFNGYPGQSRIWGRSDRFNQFTKALEELVGMKEFL
jgi:hypothetical protein